jgi:hypothetical protein
MPLRGTLKCKDGKWRNDKIILRAKNDVTVRRNYNKNGRNRWHWIGYNKYEFVIVQKSRTPKEKNLYNNSN